MVDRRRAGRRLASIAWLLLLVTACTSATPAPTPLPPTATATPGPAILPMTPLALAQAAPPTRLAIPAVGLDVAVVPMAWRVTEVGGARQAVWEVPLEAAGWHLNSAGAGAAGNVVISGHHVAGAAVFAPLAREGVQPGHQVILTTEAGEQFVYEVSEVSAPIPAVGATAADQAQMASYLAPAPQAQVTLVTGWPAFADTHYRVVVARLAGRR